MKLRVGYSSRIIIEAFGRKNNDLKVSLTDYFLRPAIEADFPEIKKLIRKVRINPTRLDWRHFTVAVLDRRMIGCAQLKQVPGGFMELASLAVEPAYRYQGVAHALIEHLLADSPRPLYLTCRSSLGDLYAKFGFRVVEAEDMPRYYKRLQRLANTLMDLTRRGETLFVMKLG
jgi:N-acetylglutamate synthase-like GNAT family acetyltransferase